MNALNLIKEARDAADNRDLSAIDYGLVYQLADALERAMSGLYNVYLELGEDPDGARNAQELFGPWVGFDPATTIPKLVARNQKDWDRDVEEVERMAWDQGAQSVFYDEVLGRLNWPENPYKEQS